MESDSSVTQDFADVHIKGQSCDNQSQLREENMQAVTVQKTTVFSQQSHRRLQEDAERDVAVYEPDQQAMAGSNNNKGANASAHNLWHA